MPPLRAGLPGAAGRDQIGTGGDACWRRRAQPREPARTLGDRYGRKRIFLTGVAWFALSSLLCGFAAGSAFLIAARAGLCLAGGALAAVTIRNPRPQADPAPQQLLHCALDAPASPAAVHR